MSVEVADGLDRNAGGKPATALTDWGAGALFGLECGVAGLTAPILQLVSLDPSARYMRRDSPQTSTARRSQKIRDIEVEAREGVEMEWCGHQLQIGQA